MVRATSPKGRHWFGILFSGFAGIFLVVGAFLAWRLMAAKVARRPDAREQERGFVDEPNPFRQG